MKSRSIGQLVVRAFGSLIAALMILPLLVTGLVIDASPASAVGTPKAVVAPPINDPQAVAVDGAGNVFFANGGASGSVAVLPAVTGTLFGISVTANQVTTLVSSGLSGPSGLALDNAGNLYITNSGSGNIEVLPKASGTLFGVTVTANTLATLVSGQGDATGIDFDSSGNLYWDRSAFGTISVLAAATGTLFGASVTADQVTTLYAGGLTGADQLSFDPAGNLYVAVSSEGYVAVLPVSTGTLFGTSVTADQVAYIGASSTQDLEGVTFDSAGNMYISGYQNDEVLVLPQAAGTYFGQSDPADTTSYVGGYGPQWPSGIAFGPSGNLFAANDHSDSIIEVSTSSGTLYGVPNTADHWATVVTGLNLPQGMAFDSSGNMFIANGEGNAIDVYPAASGTIFGVAVTAGRLATLFNYGPNLSGSLAPASLAFDSAGNLYVGSLYALYVVPVVTGTLFGISVKADQLNQIYYVDYQGPGGAMGLAFDSAGDLFSTYQNTLNVLPVANGTIFGTTVTANDPVTLESSGLSTPTGISFDSLGNLYVANAGNNTVSVLAVSTGKLYGQSVTADTLSTLISSGLNDPQDVVFDSANDLFVDNYSSGTISALTTTSKTLYGTALTADDLGAVGTGLNEPTQMTVEGGNELYFANYGGNLGGGNGAINAVSELVQASMPTPTVTSVAPSSGSTAGGSAVTITGTNLMGGTVKFGTVSAPNVTCTTATSCTGTTPSASVAGVVDVTVTTTGGTSATWSADHYTYLYPTKLVAQPAVLSVSPLGLPLFTLSATLTQSKAGAPVEPGEAVTFSAGGTTLGVGYTNASGVASLDILTNISGVLSTVEKFGYTVTFPGTATYLASAAAGPLLVL